MGFYLGLYLIFCITTSMCAVITWLGDLRSRVPLYRIGLLNFSLTILIMAPFIFLAMCIPNAKEYVIAGWAERINEK